MGWFSCSHKFGEIKDGYQYCIHCNLAVPVPCNHKWEKIKELPYTISHGNGRKEAYTAFVLQCKTCGTITEKRV